MHIVESYSLNCGAKIDKPYIYKNFFPIPFEKFIIFSPNEKVPSKEYSYFQDVLNMIFPILEKENIKILQTGPKNSFVYDKAINITGQTSSGQVAYLISNSMLVFGNDGFESHVAGAENVPTICINSITYKQNTGPYFGNKDIQKIFESYKNIGNKKASFNAQENPKSINSIKPEEIANSIFKFLNINFKIPFSTVFFGERYGRNIIQESIPSSKTISFNPETFVEINLDDEINEESFEFQISNYKKCAIVTSKKINLNILKKYKNNIQVLVFKITNGNNVEFLQKVKEIGLNIHLVSDMEQDDINREKIKYYEFGNINKIKSVSEEIINNFKNDLDKLYYRSCKITAFDNKFYFSPASKNKNITFSNQNEYQKVIDTPEFWKNLDFYTIVKLTT
jgi:hypothetical protein